MMRTQQSSSMVPRSVSPTATWHPKSLPAISMCFLAITPPSTPASLRITFQRVLLTRHSIRAPLQVISRDKGSDPSDIPFFAIQGRPASPHLGNGRSHLRDVGAVTRILTELRGGKGVLRLAFDSKYVSCVVAQGLPSAVLGEVIANSDKRLDLDVIQHMLALVGQAARLMPAYSLLWDMTLQVGSLAALTTTWQSP